LMRARGAQLVVKLECAGMDIDNEVRGLVLGAGGG